MPTIDLLGKKVKSVRLAPLYRGLTAYWRIEFTDGTVIHVDFYLYGTDNTTECKLLEGTK